MLSVVPLVSGAFRLSQLAGGAEVTPANARFFASPLPVVVHIVSAAVYAILGAFQFATGFRRRRPGWHRAAGRLLVPCGLLVGLSGLWMDLVLSLAGGRRCAAVCLAARVWLGHGCLYRPRIYRHQARDVRQHRAWMARGYAIGLGAGKQVPTLAAGELIAGPPDETSRALLMGAAWVINLLVAEWAIRRRLARVPSSPTRMASASGSQLS